MRRPRIVLLLVSACVFWFGGVANAQTPVGESSLDFDGVARVAQDLEVLIVDAVQRGGAELEFTHAHWVFLFSTGHFPGEPIRAQAARETAIQLLRRLAVPGDFVSAFAFEMELWEHGDGTTNPLELMPVGPQAFESVARMFPLTAQSGSVGGHDTELALVQVAERVGGTHSPIVIAFTNRAASITTDPATRPLIGEDDEAYRSLLSSWNRAPAINRSGASYEAVYAVTRSNGQLVTNTLDVVLLTPKDLRSVPTTAARSVLRLVFLEATPVQVAPDPAPVEIEEPAPTRRGFPWFLVAILLVAGVGVVVYLLRTGRIRLGGSSKVVTVQGATLNLADVREGAVVCRVVPRGYQDDPASSDRGPTVVHPDAPFGDEPLGRLVWSRGGLVWKDAAYQATRWLDQTVRSPVALGGHGGSLELEGVVRERPGMPPRTVRVRVEIEMGATP